jgi:hypothetical protein
MNQENQENPKELFGLEKLWSWGISRHEDLLS